MTLKILLVEDHHIIRQGIKSLLEKQEGLCVVGEAQDGREAVDLAKSLKPDVIVMDVTMPKLNGIEATRKIREDNPDAKVIALSVHSDDAFVSGMLTAGASGYLLKDCLVQELVTAIRSVANDQFYLSQSIARTVVHEYRTLKANEIRSVFSTLTSREREVLQLIAEGRTTKQIADTLFVSEKTISTHRQHIMEKLGMDSVPDLVKYAIREKLISL
jgi:two-component system, NarL family, response regulator NreC